MWTNGVVGQRVPPFDTLGDLGYQLVVWRGGMRIAQHTVQI
jgi:hypothetical protein